MTKLFFALLEAVALLPSLALVQADVREVTVDASVIIGTLKNLQGSNSADTSINQGMNDFIFNRDDTIASQFTSHAINDVMIYTFPPVFDMAWGDPTNNSLYNWTWADTYMHFLVSHGVKPWLNMAVTNGENDSVSSPEKLGEVGYMITNRYVNGAHSSGFSNALWGIDYGAESDLGNYADTNATYTSALKYFAGFANGVSKASDKVKVGAWGGNRAYPQHHNYTVDDPFVNNFYRDCAAQKVSLGAATLHFTNAQFSLDPYDVKRVVDKFQEEILVPAGLPKLPVWITEYELNPGGLIPTSEAAKAAYDDPAFVTAYTVGTSMYAQDTAVEKAFTWPGFGYNGTGAGNAPFEPWFNKTTGGIATPLNLAAAFKLQGKLVTETPNRIQVNGSSPDGFAVLAGSSCTQDQIQIFMNNYQIIEYDILREIATQASPYMNTSTTAYPLFQDNGLLNGEQMCFNTGNEKFFVPICQSFPLPTIRNNTSNAYSLTLTNLPWSSTDNYEMTIERVGGGSVHQVVGYKSGQGNRINVELPFPANAQDLITVRKTRQ